MGMKFALQKNDARGAGQVIFLDCICSLFVWVQLVSRLPSQETTREDEAVAASLV